jgi:hypothetical protein
MDIEMKHFEIIQPEYGNAIQSPEMLKMVASYGMWLEVGMGSINIF